MHKSFGICHIYIVSVYFRANLVLAHTERVFKVGTVECILLPNPVLSHTENGLFAYVFDKLIKSFLHIYTENG